MTFHGFVSAVIVGLIIGAVARIVVPNSQPIGCLLTVVIGVVAAAVGAAVGASLHWGFWLVLAVQVLIGAVIVAVFSAAARPRR